jgi:hypothetical protein
MDKAHSEWLDLIRPRLDGFEVTDDIFLSDPDFFSCPHYVLTRLGGFEGVERRKRLKINARVS